VTASKCAARGHHGERSLRVSAGVFIMPEGVPAPPAPPSGMRWVCLDCGETLGRPDTLEAAIAELIPYAPDPAPRQETTGSRLGSEWERLIVLALDNFERLIARIETDLAAGVYEKDYRERGRAWAALRHVAGRLTFHLDTAPGPDDLPEERVHVIGPRVHALGDRCLACMTALVEPFASRPS
jgi:hypothetical protein